MHEWKIITFVEATQIASPTQIEYSDCEGTERTVPTITY